MLAATQADCKKKGAKLRVVFGMVDDKDVDAVMLMLPKDAVYYFTQAQTHRAIPCETIKAKAERIGLKGKAYPSAATAYTTAKNEAAKDDVIFIGGSNYIVGEIAPEKY